MSNITTGSGLLESMKDNSSKTRSILARNDVDFDEQDGDGWTALMIAAKRNDVDTIQSLIKKRANTTIENNQGQTAVDVAQHYKSRAALKVLKSQKLFSSVRYPMINYFSHVPLNRRADKRKDSTWLSTMKTHPKSKFVLFSNLKPLAVTPEGQKKYRLSVLNYPQIENALGKESIDLNYVVFLGIEEKLTEPETNPETTQFSEQVEEVEGYAWFAIDVGNTDLASEKLLAAIPGAEYLSPRPGFLQVHVEDATILAQARPILEWHQCNKFCPRCGSTVTMEDGGYKQTCTNSDCASNKGVLNVSYPRLDPVSIMLVISKDGTKCLLGRKPTFPQGMYSCLAGYMEPGESIEDAVRREVLEESGVSVDHVEYHSSQFWPYPTQLMIGCLAHATTEKVIVDREELEDAKWFTSDTIRQACIAIRCQSSPASLWFPPRQAIARQLIEHWLDLGSSHL